MHKLIIYSLAPVGERARVRVINNAIGLHLTPHPNLLSKGEDVTALYQAHG